MISSRTVPLDSLTIPLLFEDMFVPCLQTCLYHVYRPVYTMFTDTYTPCLKTCFHNTWRIVYTMLEAIFPICLETSLNYVTPCLHLCFYTMLEHMFWTYLNICLYNVRWQYVQFVWRQFLTMFKGMFQPCSKTCLHHV